MRQPSRLTGAVPALYSSTRSARPVGAPHGVLPRIGDYVKLRGLVRAREGGLCFLGAMSEPDFQPAACRSVGDAKGRCMSLCVPAIQAKKDSLPQATCDDGQ